MKPADRKDIKEKFVCREIEVVCLVGCLNEGVSIDGIEKIIYASPQSSPTNIIRTFNRGNRLHNEKSHFNVIIPVCLSDSDEEHFKKIVEAFVENDERLKKVVAQGREGNQH